MIILFRITKSIWKKPTGAISLKEDVEKLMMCVPSRNGYELVKDLFIFSCFTGLAYADIKETDKGTTFNHSLTVISGLSAGERNQILLQMFG